jgi:NADPH2:quinone reductase
MQSADGRSLQFDLTMETLHMRAVLCRSFGAPENLTVEELPVPKAQPGEVVVKVEAAGVNYADLLMVQGRYQVKPELPFVPGLEFVGVVTEVAAGCLGWKPGDRIIGAPSDGGCFADYLAMKPDRAVPAPAGLPAALAAGFLIRHGTAYFALKHRGALKPNEWLLVSGAGGGVGLAAIEIAKRMGAKVIAAEISADKLAAARARGADATIDCSGEDLRDAVKRITGGSGYDVYLDLVGGNLFPLALRAAAPFGRILIVGFAGGEIPQVPGNYLLLKNLSAIGVGFGGAIGDMQDLCRSIVADLAAMHARQPFSEGIAGEYRLEQVPEALQQLNSRKAVGKLLVRPDR